MTTALAALRAAREVLADPARWTRNDFARDGHGIPVGWTDPAAVCWCAWGAFNKQISELGVGQYQEAIGDHQLNCAAAELFGSYPSIVNDEEGHPAVLQMYDRAIELAAAEVQP